MEIIEYANENDERTPEDRKDYISEVFSVTIYGDDPGEGGEIGVTDLLADLMHYCRLEKIDFQLALAMAENHFYEEVKENEDSKRTHQ